MPNNSMPSCQHVGPSAGRSVLGAFIAPALALACFAGSAQAQCGVIALGPVTTTSAGTGTQAIAVGDFNGDGKLDMAALNTSGSVILLLGNGTGGFASSGGVSASSAFQLAAADFNKDGKLDLMVSRASLDMVTVYSGRGNGTFATGLDFPVGNNPRNFALGDLNGDGSLDLVTPNFSGGNITVLRGTSIGGFNPVAFYAVGGAPNAACIGDVNGDGKPDVLTCLGGTSGVVVYLGNGDGTLAATSTTIAGVGGGSMALTDINNDGKLDVITLNQSLSQIFIVKGNGNGTFQTPTALPIGSVGISWGMAAADVDNDGNIDLLIPRKDANAVSVLKGNGTGTFISAAAPSTGTGPVGVAAGDFNGDGKIDFASANAGGSNVSSFLNATLINTRIITQPVPDAECLGTSVTMNVNAAGNGTLTYQWQQRKLPSTIWTNLSDGAGVSGALAKSLHVASDDVTSPQIAYRCVVTGSCGAPTSNEALVDWFIPAGFITQPDSAAATCLGGSVTLVVDTRGTSRLHRWARDIGGGNYVNLNDDSHISGSTTPILTISGATAQDAGNYRVTVFSMCGPAAISNPASVAVNVSDFNCDGFLDFTDFDTFVTAFEEGGEGADFNGDGFIDFTDFDAFVSAFNAEG